MKKYFDSFTEFIVRNYYLTALIIIFDLWYYVGSPILNLLTGNKIEMSYQTIDFITKLILVFLLIIILRYLKQKKFNNSNNLDENNELSEKSITNNQPIINNNLTDEKLKITIDYVRLLSIHEMNNKIGLAAGQKIKLIDFLQTEKKKVKSMLIERFDLKTSEADKLVENYYKKYPI